MSVFGAMMFVMRMALVAGVPPEPSLVTWTAAQSQQVDPDTMGALLITETGGTWETDKVSKRGARGLFQVMPMWAKHFGHEVDALLDPVTNAEVAAGIVVYSIDSHSRCKGKHDWRAHYKCSRNGRDECGDHVRPLMKTERALRSLAVAPRLARVRGWIGRAFSTEG